MIKTLKSAIVPYRVSPPRFHYSMRVYGTRAYFIFEHLTFNYCVQFIDLLQAKYIIFLKF